MPGGQAGGAPARSLNTRSASATARSLNTRSASATARSLNTRSASATARSLKRRRYTEERVTVIRTLGVIGAGTMGNGIAHAAARSGLNVVLYDLEDRFLDRALSTITDRKSTRLNSS